MQMDEGMDTGPIIVTQSIPIEATTTAALLHDQLGELGAQLMRTHLKDFVAGALQPRSQDAAQATHARKITKEDGWIGRLEDRRPASNGDPYKIAAAIITTTILKPMLSGDALLTFITPIPVPKNPIIKFTR